jgi:3-phenylpropionate/trans-cinnamate dioxygenase ferredoxin reductase component
VNTAARVVVVGASVAAGALVAQLRNEGFLGHITVVDADPDAPYDRPPLSKQFLTDCADRPDAPWWDERCELVRGRATALNVATSTIDVLARNGRSRKMAADDIVIATGSRPVCLPDQPDGVAHLRTAKESRAIRRFAAPGWSVVVLGAGTIGTELASSLVAAGCSVTVIDLADRPLDRFLGGHLGEEAAAWIRDAGVTLKLGIRVTDIWRSNRRWIVSTETGSVSGDLVVSAIGTRPATEWLAGSGLDASEGVRCDANGTALDTSGRPVPHVHAIGDVSAWDDGVAGSRRHEDWTTAQRQGRRLAHHLLGSTSPQPDDLDYFWSHQFGRRIQVLGRPERDAVLVQHLDAPASKESFYSLERGSETVAWIAINSPKQFATALRASMLARS